MKKIIIKGKYLHKSCIPILYLLLLFLGGCIHQYPDETPTENVSLEMELLLDGEFIPLPAITKTDEGVVNESYASRVIVEARRAGESVSTVRAVTIVNEEKLTGAQITLPSPLILNPAFYDLTVWVDYTRTETLSDTYYATEDFCSVSYLLPYEDDYCRRDAFYGNASVDLTEQEGEYKVRINLKRPLAYYRIIATDVQQFLNKQYANGHSGIGEYEIIVNYQYFLVTHLNIITGEPINSAPGFSYTRQIKLTDSMAECELAADYFLADDKSSIITVSLAVTDGKEVLLSRTTDLEIPYRRGYTTTVEGAFLSRNSGNASGGINVGVDGDYEGEININVSH